MIKFAVPTVEKFNFWSLTEKARYIDYETAPNIEPNMGGYLVYEKENVFIEYIRDGTGSATETY